MVEKILLIGLGLIFVGVVVWMYWWENGGGSSKDRESEEHNGEE